MVDHLPPGFIIRPANPDDIEAVTELMRAVDLALTGESDVSVDDTRSDWQTESFNLETDTVVVEAPQQDASGHLSIIGYAELWNRSQHVHLAGDGYVHPAYLGLGIGAELLRRVESRAREHIPLAPAGKRVFIRSGAYGHDQAAIQLFENHGYTAVRYFWRMQIDLEAVPSPVELPAGYTLRNLIPHPTGSRPTGSEPDDYREDARNFFETLQDAFQDHWGFSPWDYSDWRVHHMHHANFDPNLWYLVEDGSQAAAAAICRYRNEMGWVSSLGVRPSWRRQGLASALLRQAFTEFYRRGATQVALGVDAANPTGATRLYEQAGMRVVQKYVAYEKELPPGEGH